MSIVNNLKEQCQCTGLNVDNSCWECNRLEKFVEIFVMEDWRVVRLSPREHTISGINRFHITQKSDLSAACLHSLGWPLQPAEQRWFRHRGVMPNKDRPLVDRHAPKKGVGWLRLINWLKGIEFPWLFAHVWRLIHGSQLYQSRFSINNAIRQRNAVIWASSQKRDNA